MTATMTEQQLDYIADLQDEEDSAYTDLPPLKVALILRKQGHPLFPAPEAAAAEPESKAAEPEAPKPKRKRKPKKAPEPEVVEEEAPPALETEEPAKLVPAAAETVAPGTAVVEVAPAPVARPLPAAGPAPEVEGMEGVDARDLVIPRLQIKQPQTRDDDNLGIAEVEDGHAFLTSEVELASEARELVFLQIDPGRQFMLEYGEEKRERQLEELGLDDLVPEKQAVVCYSLDRVNPEEPEQREWSALHDNCVKCPHSQWKRSTKGKNFPPACGKIYRCLLVDITDGGATPAHFGLRSSAIKPAKALLTKLKIAARRHKTPISGLSVTMTTVAVVGKEGTYWVPKFGRVEPLERSEAEAFRALRAELLQEPATAGGGEAE